MHKRKTTQNYTLCLCINLIFYNNILLSLSSPSYVNNLGEDLDLNSFQGDARKSQGSLKSCCIYSIEVQWH